MATKLLTQGQQANATLIPAAAGEANPMNQSIPPGIVIIRHTGSTNFLGLKRKRGRPRPTGQNHADPNTMAPPPGHMNLQPKGLYQVSHFATLPIWGASSTYEGGLKLYPLRGHFLSFQKLLGR